MDPDFRGGAGGGAAWGQGGDGAERAELAVVRGVGVGGDAAVQLVQDVQVTAVAAEAGVARAGAGMGVAGALAAGGLVMCPSEGTTLDWYCTQPVSSVAAQTSVAATAPRPVVSATGGVVESRRTVCRSDMLCILP